MNPLSGAYRPLVALASIVLVVAALYFGRAVLVPLALAILLAFLLNPIVSALSRRGVPAAPAAVLVLVAALGLLAGLVVVVTLQLRGLVEQLPEYRANIYDKLGNLRAMQEGPFSDTAQETLTEIKGELEKTVEPEPEAEAVPVRIEDQSVPMLGQLPSLLEYLATTGLVIVLVLFLLLGGRTLRDRLILLFGHRNLTLTTRAMDEATSRISRYLLMQAAMNASFGVLVTLALWALGVDYALMWGFFAAVLRFIPYVGPWLAAGMPVLLSLAMFPGWARPLSVVGAFAVLELTLNMVVEPLVYGRTAGVSEVALLVSITFWTWLWGPIGLILATPLTVCLVVLSKYVPQLGFIPLLMGDTPVGTPEVRFYQRLLAHDEDEAVEIAQEVQGESAEDELPDLLVLPTLVALRRDVREGVLGEEEARDVLGGLESVLEVLLAPAATVPAVAEPAVVLGYPVSDGIDRLALVALATLTRRTERCLLDVLAPGLLVSELVERVIAVSPAVVCVASVGPGGVSRAVLAVKRLRAQCPGVRVVVGRWGGSPEGVERLLAAGAQRVCTSLAATRNELHDLSRLEPPPPDGREPSLRPSAAGGAVVIPPAPGAALG